MVARLLAISLLILAFSMSDVCGSGDSLDVRQMLELRRYVECREEDVPDRDGMTVDVGLMKRSSNRGGRKRLSSRCGVVPAVAEIAQKAPRESESQCRRPDAVWERLLPARREFPGREQRQRQRRGGWQVVVVVMSGLEREKGARRDELDTIWRVDSPI